MNLLRVQLISSVGIENKLRTFHCLLLVLDIGLTRIYANSLFELENSHEMETNSPKNVSVELSCFLHLKMMFAMSRQRLCYKFVHQTLNIPLYLPPSAFTRPRYVHQCDSN